MEKVPTGVVAEVDILRVETTAPFAGTVTMPVPGVNVQVGPAGVQKLHALPEGRPVQVRATAPANPFTELTVAVGLALCPGATLAEELDKLKLKS
jgi:hypothetical protein